MASIQNPKVTAAILMHVATELYLYVTAREDNPHLYSVNSCIKVFILYASLLSHTHDAAMGD